MKNLLEILTEPQLGDRYLSNLDSIVVVEDIAYSGEARTYKIVFEDKSFSYVKATYIQKYFKLVL